MEKFSVLMSIYKNDKPEFFKEALESVTIKQSLKPNQVVIVYDGKVDKKIDEIIELVKQLNTEIEYTIVKLDKNSGLAVALNKGIKQCKYELIARMDSDDIALPDRFEKQIKCFDENNQIVLLGGAISEFKEKPNIINSTRMVPIDEKEIRKMAKHRNPFNHMTVMYKKSNVLNVGGYTEDFGKLEDYKLWVDMLSKQYKVANLPDILVNVRVGNGFIERRSNKQEIKDWDNLQKHLYNANIVNKFDIFVNKIYIRCFIYMPKFLKKFFYLKILRK